jgi:malate dehydrogenase (oxaloacetate-decarboxylating)
MVDYGKQALDIHKKFKGKIHISLNDKNIDIDKLKLYYTPGVAAVSLAIAKNPLKLKDYTWTNNNVAVISDGSAVLGLGNIGPRAALPVMEGKCFLFKYFAGINAVPIVIDAHSAQEIIDCVKAIAPSFGGINLEDIAAPICFEVEERLAQELPIPIFHDDQHGTAIVTLAGLINATKITQRNLGQSKIVLVGAGAAGIAIIKLIKKYAPQANIIAVDSKGIISNKRHDLNDNKKNVLKLTNHQNLSGSLSNAVHQADIFIGVSSPNILSEEMVKSMHTKPIIFAMANPDPEIKPNLAQKAGAAVVATGRSDYPNQVNNALAFPGIFKGALDHHIRHITDEHKIKAAEVIASLVANPTADMIVPSINDKRLVVSIAKVIV